jgi:hypothetical protein
MFHWFVYFITCSWLRLNFCSELFSVQIFLPYSPSFQRSIIVIVWIAALQKVKYHRKENIIISNFLHSSYIFYCVSLLHWRGLYLRVSIIAPVTITTWLWPLFHWSRYSVFLPPPISWLILLPLTRALDIPSLRPSLRGMVGKSLGLRRMMAS